MTSVSIIGNGNMATAIGGVLADGGAQVEYVGRDLAQAPSGDIVVLAVPYPALAEIAAGRADQLAGKVVVDITNPLDFSTFDSLVVPSDSQCRCRTRRRAPAVEGAQGVQHHLRRDPECQAGRNGQDDGAHRG